MRKKPLKTFYIRETIVVEQEVISRSREDAERIYNDMMKSDEIRAILTRSGATSSSTTETELDVLTLDEYEGELG